MQGSLSIERMCQLAQVSRAEFYRSLAEKKPLEEGDGSARGDSPMTAAALHPQLHVWVDI